MNDSTQNQFIADLARDLVAKVAPEEIPLFRANSEAYFKDPEKVLKGQIGKDEMLGFGAGAAMSFLTPVALAVIVEVVKFVTEEVKKCIKMESADIISDVVKNMFKKFRSVDDKEEKPVLAPLTLEQLLEVHKMAISKARHFKLPESKAKQLADALIGDLVVTG